VNPEDEPHPRTLLLANIGADEERSLRSMLGLLKSHLEPPWCIAARFGDIPDAVLVDLDSAEGRDIWANLEFGGRPRIALSRDVVLAAEWTLLRPLRAGGTHSLTDILQAVAEKIALLVPGAPPPGKNRRIFAKLVRRACQKSYPVEIMLATGSALLVDSQHQVYYSSRTHDELMVLLGNRRRIEAKAMAVPERDAFAERLAHSGILPRPLEELLWLTGLVSGAGESLGTWDPGEPVRLRRWPNFDALPYRKRHLNMAAMLTRESALPAAVAEACHTRNGDVADFLNACAEIGILETRAARAGSNLQSEDSMKTTLMDAWRNVVGTLKR
jgi:hypothetical protein